jgi:Serine hydrolase (FSH1)
MMGGNAIYVVASLSLLACIGACAMPEVNADHLAYEKGYQKLMLHGGVFDHVAYFKPAAGQPTALHVYIDHDGLPWRSRYDRSSDPTPRNPAMLKWMSSDPDNALYLGRPCYFGLADVPPCGIPWWTDRRFSPEVVDSLTLALSRFMTSHGPFTDVVLFGYSGGGVLAVLMADKLDSARQVVTIAAPLDLEAWSVLHRYSRLEGSLNPATYAFSGHRIDEIHWFGGRDTVVPPKMSADYFRRRPQATTREMETFDHVCCWEQTWPTVLKEMGL